MNSITSVIGMFIIGIVVVSLIGIVLVHGQEISDPLIQTQLEGTAVTPEGKPLSNDTSSLMQYDTFIPKELSLDDYKGRTEELDALASKYAKLYFDCKTSADNQLVTVPLSLLRGSGNK